MKYNILSAHEQNRLRVTNILLKNTRALKLIYINIEENESRLLSSVQLLKINLREINRHERTIYKNKLHRKLARKKGTKLDDLNQSSKLKGFKILIFRMHFIRS